MKKKRPVHFELTREVLLFLETEFLYNSAVALLVVCFQILQMSAAVCNHLEKAATRVFVFKMFLQMKRKFVDTLAEYSNLNLGRAGISVVNCDFFYDFLLFPLCQHEQYGSTSPAFSQGVRHTGPYLASRRVAQFFRARMALWQQI